MIWSTPAPTVQKFESMAGTMGQPLRESRAINRLLKASGVDLEPVRYTEHSKLTLTDETKLVTPIVTLGNDGTLTHPSHGFYIVAMQGFRRPSITQRAQTTLAEAHAFAERTALTRGIFDTQARASAEKMVIDALWAPHRKEFAEERRDYLDVLQEEASAELAGLEKRRVLSGLRRAVEILDGYID